MNRIIKASGMLVSIAILSSAQLATAQGGQIATAADGYEESVDAFSWVFTWNKDFSEPNPAMSFTPGNTGAMMPGPNPGDPAVPFTPVLWMPSLTFDVDILPGLSTAHIVWESQHTSKPHLTDAPNGNEFVAKSEVWYNDGLTNTDFNILFPATGNTNFNTPLTPDFTASFTEKIVTHPGNPDHRDTYKLLYMRKNAADNIVFQFTGAHSGVPEPGAFVLLAVGSPMLIRRRR
jgi:hypothetical protein